MHQYLVFCQASKCSYGETAVGHWEAFALLNTSRPLLTFSYAPGLLPLLAKAGQHREIARILSKVAHSLV